LLEADVNVKLVATLRKQVKAKVKPALESTDKAKEAQRKNIIHKVGQHGICHFYGLNYIVRPFMTNWCN
jgi:signal recognition particle GTPase